MAIAYDIKGTKNGVSGSVVSWPHTVGAGVTNGIIFAYFFNGGTAPPISAGSLKFAGLNMTLLLSGTQTGDPFSGDLWYLLNPPTGLGTFNGTFKAVPSGGEYDCLSESYSGVNQSTPFAGSSFKVGTSQSTPGTLAFTSLPSNAWAVGFAAYDNNTGTIATGNFRGTAGSGAMVVGGDSTGGTLAWSNSNNTSNYVLLGAQLQAFSGAVSIGYKSLLGVGL